MRAYVNAMLLVGVLVTVGGRLISDRRFASVTRWLLSLILLAALVRPLIGVVEQLGTVEIPLPELGDASTFDESMGEAYASGIARALCAQFSLSEDEVRVVVDGYVPEAPEEAYVEVFLTGRAALGDRLRMERYLKEGGILNCEITIGF